LDRSLGARYAIGDLVGRGGMGAVFQATDRRHERLVAIKASEPRFQAVMRKRNFPE
jgi:serine/threonine protein kinase